MIKNHSIITHLEGEKKKNVTIGTFSLADSNFLRELLGHNYEQSDHDMI